MCVCVCVSEREREKEGERVGGHRKLFDCNSNVLFFPAKLQLDTIHVHVYVYIWEPTNAASKGTSPGSAFVKREKRRLPKSSTRESRLCLGASWIEAF